MAPQTGLTIYILTICDGLFFKPVLVAGASRSISITAVLSYTDISPSTPHQEKHMKGVSCLDIVALLLSVLLQDLDSTGYDALAMHTTAISRCFDHHIGRCCCRRC